MFKAIHDVLNVRHILKWKIPDVRNLFWTIKMIFPLWVIIRLWWYCCSNSRCCFKPLSFAVCYSTVCSVCSNYTREITYLSLDWPFYSLPLKRVCLITECMYERYDEAVFMWDAGDSLSECKHDECYIPVCSVKRSHSPSIYLLALSSYACLVCGEMQFFM